MGRTRQNTRRARRMRRHQRIRRRVRGSAERPRLVMFRSLKNIEGQIIDDARGVTLVGLSTLTGELRERREAEGLTKTEISRTAGKMLAERARERGIDQVVFDRGGYLYHGRVKAFAEGAREGGLDF